MPHRALIVAAAMVLLQSAAPLDGGSGSIHVSQEQERRLSFSIATFNTENLFDTVDDPTKDDETYLPRAAKDTPSHAKRCLKQKLPPRRRDCLELDWSEATLSVKLAALAKAIATAAGQCPDVLVLQEVETKELLERLSTEHLKHCGFSSALLLEGDDPRGIDVGVLSAFPAMDRGVLHRSSNRSARGIFETRFQIAPAAPVLTVLAVHFPSQAVSSARRESAMARLAQLAIAAAKRGDAVVAAGDFNVDAEEEALVYRQIAGSDWRLAHREGCDSCLGTYFYRGEKRWSFFDNILLWRGSRLAFVPGSIRATSGLPVHVDGLGRPRRFGVDFAGVATGVSDHLPLRATISVLVPSRQSQDWTRNSSSLDASGF